MYLVLLVLGIFLFLITNTVRLNKVGPGYSNGSRISSMIVGTVLYWVLIEISQYLERANGRNNAGTYTMLFFVAVVFVFLLQIAMLYVPYIDRALGILLTIILGVLNLALLVYAFWFGMSLIKEIGWAMLFLCAYHYNVLIVSISASINVIRCSEP